MAIKYQIFLSSTYEDLVIEREQIIRAVLEMGHIPVGMEMFSAADEQQWKIITRQIDEIDYYAVVVGHRYGSVAADGTSYTEMEYDYAVSRGIPVLGFVLDDKASWPVDQMEQDDEKRIRLERFREKVKSRMVNFWENKNDLHAKFSIALMKAITAYPRPGWTRASDVAGPEVIKELTRLSAENSALRRDIETLQRNEDQQESERRRELVRILAKNSVQLYVRKVSHNWGNPIESTLLRIFEAVAPKLLIENAPEEMARDIALQLGGIGYYHSWPVPENYVAHWIADLSALELIQPSQRKHSVQDGSDYWSLSPVGSDVLRYLRRFRLEQGVKTEEEKPEVKSES